MNDMLFAGVKHQANPSERNIFTITRRLTGTEVSWPIQLIPLTGRWLSHEETSRDTGNRSHDPFNGHRRGERGLAMAEYREVQRTGVTEPSSRS